MEDDGVIKLYEPSQTPCLYVAPAENMVGQSPVDPLIPGRQQNINTPTQVQHRDSGFPMGCADAALVDGTAHNHGRRSSDVYEVS